MGYDEFGDYIPTTPSSGIEVAGAGGLNLPTSPSEGLGIAGGAADVGEEAVGGGGGLEVEPGSPEDLGVAGGPAEPEIDALLQKILNSGLPPAVIEEIIKSYLGQKQMGVQPQGLSEELGGEGGGAEDFGVGEILKSEEAKLNPMGTPRVAMTENPFMEAAKQIAMFAESQAGRGLPQVRSAPGAGAPSMEGNMYAPQQELMDRLFGQKLRKTRSLAMGQPENPQSLLGMA